MGVFVQVNETSRKGRAHPVGYIVQESGCWEWVGTINPDGYGQFRVDGSLRRAHRVLYEQSNGPIPPGLTLDHLCRNRGCVRPDHLEAVSQRVNTMRGDTPAARNAGKTHCPMGHALGAGNLVASQVKQGWRRCRECYNAGHRARRLRQKGVV